jgi:hypothetical protein
MEWSGALVAGFSPEWDEALPSRHLVSFVVNVFWVRWTCEDPQPARQCHTRGRRLCLTGSIGNTVTRITAKNGRRKNPERSRRETKPSVHGGFKCPARAPFPAARSVELSCNQSANPCSSVPSVASHFILASSVRTSTPRAGSSARNPSQRAFPARMKSMNVRSIPCG